MVIYENHGTNKKGIALTKAYSDAGYYIEKPTTPPSLANANAFSGIPADCAFYVPAESLEAYKTATNWSTYADRMQTIPEG